MRIMRTGLSTVIAVYLLTGCAPPTTPDYDAPDASAPEDEPKIISVVPKPGSEEVNRRPIIRITFDRQLDARTVQNHTMRLYTGPTGMWLHSYYDPFKKQIIAWPAGYLLRKCTWVLELKKGLLSTSEIPVFPKVATSFRTGDEIIVETPYKIRYFKSDILPIFEKHCTSCHGGQNAVAGIKLDNEDNISSTAIGKPSTGRPDWDLIVPTRPGLSYLLYKLIDDDAIPGLTMPRNFEKDSPTDLLSAEEKQSLLDWIAAGAVFFDPEVTNK